MPVTIGWNTTSTLHDLPGASGEPEHLSLCIEKGSAATMLVKATGSVLDLLVTVTTSGELEWVTAT